MSRAAGFLNHDHSYIHSQGLASLVWTVNHNLNRFPSVSPVNSANTIMNPTIDYIDKNTLTLTFLTPVLGKAYLN